MFKKRDVIQIDLETVIRFFDLLADEEIFNNETNQVWLWGKVQFIIDYFKQNNLDFISYEKLNELIHTEKHKLHFNENNHAFTKSNALELDNLIQSEPFVQSLTSVVLSAWGKYFSHYVEQTKEERFTKHHFFSILNISIVSFILFGIFYSWKNFGAIGILSAVGFGVYYGMKKLAFKVSAHREQKSISKKVQQVLAAQENDLFNIFDDLGLEPWTVDREVNEELKKFKNKTLHFISIYNKREKNRNPAMLLDLEKMWKKHIPIFVDKIAENSNNKSLIIETLKSMECVLEKHIETLFWDDKLEITATQRYWLHKETEKNI